MSSISAGPKRRNPDGRIVLSWPLVPRGYLGKPSANSDDDQRRRKPGHKARRDRMELNRPSSYGREGTAWKWSVSGQEANAAHRGLPTRWSRTSGFGGWVEQWRSESTADDQAGTSMSRTSHCCRNRVESIRTRAREWVVSESANDARHEYDAGGRNRFVRVSWCGPPSTVLGLGEDRDSVWPYQTPVRPRCWKAPQCHVSRVFFLNWIGLLHDTNSQQQTKQQLKII